MTREIPRGEWVQFFDTFSRRYEGWVATVEFLDADIGAQVERTLGFEGLNADLKSGENLITLSLGGHPNARVTHTIVSPTHVWCDRREVGNGVAESLKIECSSGVATLVSFIPESVAERIEAFPALVAAAKA